MTAAAWYHRTMTSEKERQRQAQIRRIPIPKGPRHGNFDALPLPEEHITLAEAIKRYPDAFTAQGAPKSLQPDSMVELETRTGAMTVCDHESGVNWVYFPGEGWDGY